MGATNPRRSSAKFKGPKLSLSAVVTLAILLLLSVLLPVHARIYYGQIWNGYRLNINDTLRSPDGTKTLHVTLRGGLVLKDGDKTIWKKQICSGHWEQNHYLAVENESIGFYTPADHRCDEFANTVDSAVKSLVLGNNGVLYATDYLPMLLWTNTCNIPLR
ncbi:MAG: hypothetical protein J3Q66DRAFT_357387 [Benniella sp.]|nr:MAG: hypothetical protein J3Q66DRAFT_357387 [Benniella sp.]